MVRCIFLIFGVLALAACASSQRSKGNQHQRYTGDQPDHNIATVCHAVTKMNQFINNERLVIKEINGVEGYFPNPVQLRSGRYKIRVEYMVNGLNMNLVKDAVLMTVAGPIVGPMIITNQSIARMNKDRELRKGEFLIEVDGGKSYQLSYSTELKKYDDLSIALTEIPNSSYKSGKPTCRVRQ